MKTFHFLVLALFCLSGCSNPGSEYAKAHPELSQAHREILVHGKVPDGDAVAGMSKRQVMLALGSPATFEKFDGEDAWIYFGSGQSETSAFNTYDSPSSTAPGTDRNFTETESFAASQKVTKTTIFFRGDRAVRADITAESRK